MNLLNNWLIQAIIGNAVCFLLSQTLILGIKIIKKALSHKQNCKNYFQIKKTKTLSLKPLVYFALTSFKLPIFIFIIPLLSLYEKLILLSPLIMSDCFVFLVFEFFSYRIKYFERKRR